MDNSGVYRVRRPAEISLLLSLSLILGIQIVSIIKNNINSERQLLFFLGVGWMLFCLSIVCILIYRLFTLTRVIEIQFRPQNILMNEIIIDAKDIKTVFIKGYFKPVIGIKLRKNLLVPYRLCFRFLDKEDQAIEELTTWAMKNQINVANKRFQRWL